MTNDTAAGSAFALRERNRLARWGKAASRRLSWPETVSSGQARPIRAARGHSRGVSGGADGRLCDQYDVSLPDAKLSCIVHLTVDKF